MHDDAMVPDKAETRRAFDRAADTYDAAAVLQREVGRRLVERLEIVKLQPDNVLDIGAGTGATTRELMQHYPRARFTGVDVAPRMLAKARGRAPWLRKLRCLCADAESLPLRSNSYDLIFSNLAMQWVGDLDRAFREIQRVLRPGGVLMFSSFGPDTLRELREAWSAVDGYNHVNRFIDLHDVGDAMTRARLADPVMDMEYFSLTYDRASELMRDLKRIGAHNVTGGRSRALTGRGRLRALESAYEAFRQPDGRLPATYEVVYGHAWGTDAQPQERSADGEVRVPVAGIPHRKR